MKLCLPFSLVVHFFSGHLRPDSIGHGRWKPGCAALCIALRILFYLSPSRANGLETRGFFYAPSGP